VAGLSSWLLITGVDDRGDEMQKPEVQCSCPYLAPQMWDAADQGGRSEPLKRLRPTRSGHIWVLPVS
jgi:hypothetical protein